MEYDRGGGGYGYSSQGASRGSAIRGPSMERGGGGGYGHHQPAPVGIAPVFRGGSAHRDEYGNGGQYGAPHGGGYGSSASPASSGIGRGGGSGGDARSAQINEYVAKQKAAKQNAPLIRKVSQEHIVAGRRVTVQSLLLFFANSLLTRIFVFPRPTRKTNVWLKRALHLPHAQRRLRLIRTMTTWTTTAAVATTNPPRTMGDRRLLRRDRAHASQQRRAVARAEAMPHRHRRLHNQLIDVNLLDRARGL
jgi:hypothetical protein